MLRVALCVTCFELFLQTGFGEAAICCDTIKSDIENRSNAYNVLCSEKDPRLVNCCHVLAQDLRNRHFSYRTLCPNHVVDHCQSNPCHVNATCISLQDSFNCTCKTGFVGSGLECKRVVDHCQSNPCHVNATCISLQDSFNCTCKTDVVGSGLECKIAAAKSCAELFKTGVREDGVYTIDPDGLGSFPVRCDMTKDGGGWTLFQRRQNGSQDFYRGWSDYKTGFGDLNREFWLGLDKIHRLSKSGQNVLRIDMMDFNGVQRYAKYESFSVANESDKYRINIGNFSGDAGDSLTYHNQMQFSTKDSDNDSSSNNCAEYYRGAWWYKSCYVSNLNGLYLGAGQGDYTGIQWQAFKRRSLKKTEIKTRPSRF